MLEQMKRLAAQTGEAAMPARLMFGAVTGTQPLRILVDSRFEISGEAVVLMRQFRAGKYATHTHAVPAHSALAAGEHGHGVPAQETGEAAGEVARHSHGVPEHATTAAGGHIHGIPEGTTTVEAYAGLAVGDKVVLLRNHGGQQFLVLGRL